MPSNVTLASVCAPSDKVVARDISGDTLIVPLVGGVGDEDDALYTLNAEGRAIWQMLDGRRALGAVAAALAAEYDAPLAELEADVLGFAGELVRRGILDVAGCKA